MEKKQVCKGNDCIFCNSKCPACDSMNIRVTFKPIFEYENGTVTDIDISRVGAEIELECYACGEHFNDDEELRPLIKAIETVFDTPGNLSIGHNSETGEINIESYIEVGPDNK